MGKFTLLLAISLTFLASGPLSQGAQQTPTDVTAVEAQYREQANKNIQAYRMGDAVIEFRTNDGSPITRAEVRIDQQTQDFLFGNLAFDLATQGRGPADPRERALWERRFLDVFNLAVLPFYWNSYEQEPGKPRWKDMEPVIAWCRANGVTIKGHPLSWGDTLPPWLSKFPENTLDSLLASRILTNTSGFAGQISVWDVVNEPIHQVPFGMSRAKPYTLSEAADAIEKALRWAHTGDPNATLVVNEYDVVSNLWLDDMQPPRVTRPYKSYHPVGATSPRETFVRLIQEVDRRGVPKYDIGLQTHEPEFDWFRPQDFWDTIDAVAKLGHRVHITEMIFPSNGKSITGGWRTGNWTREAQADYGEQMYRIAFGHPAVESINYWGISDRGIWRDEGGWIDRDYRPKPIYDRLRGLIRGDWMTRNLTLKTDDSGVVRFRGFYGTYRATVRTVDGAEQSVQLHMSRDQEPRWTFRLRAK